MRCEDVIQQLPWRLNGSLTAEENAAIDAHLANCDRCRQAAADVGFVLHAVETSHPPVEDLTRVAFGEADDDLRSRVADHVAQCGRCAREWAQAEASAREAPPLPPVDTGAVVAGGVGGDAHPQAAAIPLDLRPSTPFGVMSAAMLVTAVVSAMIMGWGWRSAHLAVTAEAEQRATAVATLAQRDVDLERALDRTAQLEGDADARARAAVQGIDLDALGTVHVQTLMGGGDDDTASVTPGLENGARLSIQGSLSWPDAVGVEVRDPAGRLVVLRLAVPRSDEGPYHVPIPPTWLTGVDGGDELTVVVFDDGGAVRQTLETYRVRWPSMSDGARESN